MSDGNTATTLAPSEDEMNKIAETFAKMRDAVINASALGVEVAQLRSEVNEVRSQWQTEISQVRGEMESLRSTNHWLDSQVTELRGQRDQANRDKAAALDELNKVQKERDGLVNTVDNQRGELHRLNEEVSRLKKERDDMELVAIALEEVVQELKTKLNTISAIFNPPTSANEQPRLPTGQFAPKGEEPEQTEPDWLAPTSVTQYPY